MHIVKDKRTVLFILLGAFFIANALIAELIGVKIFSLEKLFGFKPVNWTFLGQDNLSFNLTLGVILWPVVFVMTDIINEYFGRKGVRLLTYIAVGLILYAFLMFYIGMNLEPADFWPTSHIKPNWSEEYKAEMLSKVSDYDYAFRVVFNQSNWIIIGSLVAFLIGQMVDVLVFQRIKKITGENKLWLRATGSTLVSQFLDSFVVLFIAFYIGAGWPIVLVLAIGTLNYIYKFILAIILTPVIYLMHYLIDSYLGKDLATELKELAKK
jgi:uncharacterized PurR-regulated membrane protein YhhQ (DUF165 family)